MPGTIVGPSQGGPLQRLPTVGGGEGKGEEKEEKMRRRQKATECPAHSRGKRVSQEKGTYNMFSGAN